MIFQIAFFSLGKSELLKQIAIYAGITMILVPVSSGELNRPLVGETEKLLSDIMRHAHTIPFLICAMTIDGISVILAHIEGLKNVPNLIFLVQLIAEI